MGDYAKPTLVKGDGKVIVKVRLQSLFVLSEKERKWEECEVLTDFFDSFRIFFPFAKTQSPLHITDG